MPTIEVRDGEVFAGEVKIGIVKEDGVQFLQGMKSRYGKAVEEELGTVMREEKGERKSGGTGVTEAGVPDGTTEEVAEVKKKPEELPLPPFDKTLGTDTPGFQEWKQKYCVTPEMQERIVRKLEMM